jgi:hypothetical protein
MKLDTWKLHDKDLFMNNHVVYVLQTYEAEP